MTAVPAQPDRPWRRAGSAATAAVLALGLLVLGLAAPTAARADTAPAPGTPATVSADALPTVQVNGVVWSMVTVNGIVYATGSFTQARPAGAAPGTQQTPRANLLAFNLATGALVTGFNHTLNGQGRTITASPDGSRIYVGGDFTTVDGVARGHIAAFSTATGALVTGFAPTTNGAVYSLAATASTVYAGGNFTSAGGQSRTRLAAFSASTGAMTSWAPTANHIVRGIVLNGAGTRVLLGGQFSQISGVPAIALASVDTAGGDVRTWDYGITNEGDNGGVYSLRFDGRNAYANTYGFQVGNIEGTVAFDPDTLALVWMNDCHGDPYDTYTAGNVVYAVGHAHDCETSGNFPDLNPRVWKRGIAMTIEPTGILKATTEVPRYGSWEGRPHPTVLNWWPTLNAGTYTGQAQGPWALTGSGGYVVMGGEFTTVNGVGQQSLVRFADSSTAPDRRGPELSASAMRPNAVAVAAGSVKVTWPQSWDMDNETLTYDVYRGSGTTPVHTVAAAAQWWNGTLMSWTDTGRPAGSSASYRVVVRDPFGNSVTSVQSNTVTVPATTSPYVGQVFADAPSAYWRLGETSGTTAYDAVGTTNLTESAGISRGTAGAVAGDTAVTADGTAAGRANTTALVTEPNTGFSVEAWVRTTSTAGGVVVQYGEQLTAADVANTDRALYVDAGGRASFGITVRGADRVTRYTAVRSPQVVNDGRWHHLVATVGAQGTVLYVDGAAVAQDAARTAANPRTGPAYWLVGSGTLTGAPDVPASANLAGSVDEVAIYRTALPADRVAAHHAAATGAPVNTPPTASFTATATATQLAVSVDGSASADADGTVTAHSWNWGDGSAAGTGATASHTYAAAGTYTVTLTVTDDDGATATTTRSVTVTAPPANAAPTASFTATAAQLAVSVDGSASADTDGTVTAHSWNWGDGSAAGTGATASHTYAAAGTYTVTLTVTDDDGATATTTRSVTVTVTAPPAGGEPFAGDSFARSVTGGLGTADVGGPWTASAGASRQSVTPGTAVLAAGAGQTTASSLAAVSQPNADVTTTVTLDRAPTGGGLTLSVLGRRVSAGSDYELRVRFLADGSVRLGAVRQVNGTETLIGAEVAMAGRYTPGTPLQLRVQVSGSGTTTIQAKAWTGTAEPAAWALSRTDTTAALQSPGGVGLEVYLSGSATAAVQARFTAFAARPVV
ncbi:MULTISPECIES: PKD domain-containing protein [unclassified Blastococcus]